MPARFQVKRKRTRWRGQQVRQQQPPKQPATGKRKAALDLHGPGDAQENLSKADKNLPGNECDESAKVPVQDRPDPLVNLGQRAEEHEEDGQREERHRQP